MRQNLSTCLKGAALVWYTSELITDQKRLLTMGHGIDKWERKLVGRFGKKPSNITTPTVVREEHTISDARNWQEPSGEYANCIIQPDSNLYCLTTDLDQTCFSSCASSAADRDIVYQSPTRDNSDAAADRASSMGETQQVLNQANAKQVDRPKPTLIITAGPANKPDSPSSSALSNSSNVFYTTNASRSNNNLQAPEKHWNNRNRWYHKEYGDQDTSDKMNENRPDRRSNSYDSQHIQQLLQHLLSHLCYASFTSHSAIYTFDEPTQIPFSILFHNSLQTAIEYAPVA